MNHKCPCLHQILKPLLGDAFHRRAVLPFSGFVDKVFSSSLACGIGYLAVAAAVTAFVVIDSLDQGMSDSVIRKCGHNLKISLISGELYVNRTHIRVQ